ncbi:CRTAC1 family protein [Motiliproteus sp. MSK22-1]|uniref:CRTAC1 family protein n=1 Tax=Motiliproteus sp. MSK22-1 TaxID=1897630 RepID=UPI0009785942|nr:CRTAC1 family protein [Motiliproteus sp. MSK22-1]OMH25731.1 hypothetical protein BGP75_24670 [Motiliproteus sp. MSK22-1]
MSQSVVLGVMSLYLSAFSFSVADGPFVFEEVTDQVVDLNPPGIGNVFDYAFMDINDDNRLDIVLNNHHRNNPTPIYLGTSDNKFKFWKNFPEENAAHAGFWLGEVDLNGDGKTDLVHTGNEGGVVININTAEKGAYEPQYMPINLKPPSPYAAFIDFNGDGVLETLTKPGLIYQDVTKKADQEGIFHGLFVISDFNNDGWPDLFSPGNRGRHARWNGPRRLYQNNQGVLEQIDGGRSLMKGYLGGFARTADFNNDGNMDIYIFASKKMTPEGEVLNKKIFPMKLFLGDGQFGFTDVSEQAGIAKSTQRSGYSQVYLADLDNDSFVDIVNQGNYGTVCWRNNGDGSFSEVPVASTPWAINKHLRFDDYDMDGRLDVVTGGPGASWKSRKTSVSVFRNVTDNKNRWLKLQVRQSDKNTMGIGAVITIYRAGTAKIIGKQLMLSDTAGRNPRMHFGLGQIDKVDIEVIFPTTKKKTRFNDVEANRYVVLQPDGSVTDVVFGKE